MTDATGTRVRDRMCGDAGSFPPCWLKPGHTGSHANATGSFWDASSNRAANGSCRCCGAKAGVSCLHDAIPNSAADLGSGECGDCECWDDATCYRGHATRNRILADEVTATARWREIREVSTELLRQGNHDPAEVIENAMKDGVDISIHLANGTLPDGW